MTISSWTNLIFSMCMTMILFRLIEDKRFIHAICVFVAFAAIVIERIYGG